MRSSRGPATALTRDIGIDLGTANTLVHVAGRGVVLNEPSVIAVTKEDGRALKVGHEAKRMIGRTPQHIEAVRPMRDGVISDYVRTEEMLRLFLGRVTNRFLLKKSVVLGVPSGSTEVERRAVLEAARNAGATQAYVIEEPLAAAIGAGLAFKEPSGVIVVDIGGGTTEVAIVSMGGIVHSHSVRIGGDEIDEAIVAYARRAYNLLIGDQTAEQTKLELGSAVALEQELKREIRGRDLVSGLPRSVIVSSGEIREAIQEPLRDIIEAVKMTLELAPPELAGDALERGITLAGGGALLRGFDRLIQEQTQVQVRLARDPMSCVVRGTGCVAEQMHGNPAMRKMLQKASLH